MKIKKERTPQQIINKQKKKIKQLNEVIVELRKENLRLKIEKNDLIKGRENAKAKI